MTAASNFKKGKTSHLMDLAYEEVKKGICDGSIEPGTILSEGKIARELGMSRTPVREALKALAAEGFLDIRVGIGACVRQISYKELEDLYDVRRALEVLAAKTAISRITAAEIDRLEKAFSDLLDRHHRNEVIEQKEFIEIDLALHLLLVEKCGNQVVRDFMNTIMGNIRRIQTISFQANNDLEESTRQHQQLLELIREGEYEPLAEALIQHLDWSLSCIDTF